MDQACQLAARGFERRQVFAEGAGQGNERVERCYMEEILGNHINVKKAFLG